MREKVIDDFAYKGICKTTRRKDELIICNENISRDFMEMFAESYLHGYDTIFDFKMVNQIVVPFI